MIAVGSSAFLIILYHYTRFHIPKFITISKVFISEDVFGSHLHSTESSGHFITQGEILDDKIGYKEEDAILQEDSVFHFLLSDVISGFPLQWTRPPKNVDVYFLCYEKWILFLLIYQVSSLCMASRKFFLLRYWWRYGCMNSDWLKGPKILSSFSLTYQCSKA